MQRPKLCLVHCQCMHLRMTDAQAVFLHERLYIGGGYMDAEEDEYTVLIFNPDTKEWFQLPRAPTRHFAMVAIDGEKLVLTGGEECKHGSVSDLVVVWDSRYDQWIMPYLSMPTARTGATAVSYQHFIIVAGGHSADGSPLATVELLDTKKVQWYTADPLPLRCFRPTMAQFGDTLYVIGGGTMASIAILPLIFHATSGMLPKDPIRSKLPNVPLEFSTAVCLESTRSLLLLGGKDGHRGSPAVHIYNPRDETWEKLGELPAARSCSIAVPFPSGKDIALVGGYTDTDSRSNMLYILTAVVSGQL